MIRLAAAATASALALAVAGCGFGAGRGTGGVSLRVTRDFGLQRMAMLRGLRVPGEETALRVLERRFRVSTRYGGGFVQSVDGRAGTGDRRDWFFYVNGAEAPAGAAATLLHRGDRVWWDLHDWRAAEATPAVVGDYPAPFAGRSYSLICPRGGPACAAVRTRLNSAGGSPRAGAPLRVLVGTWQELSGAGAGPLADGPAGSGVYARFRSGRSQSLELLDPGGRVTERATVAAGLLAALSSRPGHVVWLITGSDQAGVRAAASHLDERDLAGRFAVAILGTRVQPVPEHAGA